MLFIIFKGGLNSLLDIKFSFICVRGACIIHYSAEFSACVHSSLSSVLLETWARSRIEWLPSLSLIRRLPGAFSFSDIGMIWASVTGAPAY